MTGVAEDTFLKLLKDMGCACASYHDAHVRNLRVRRVQCDEIWEFIGAQAKNVTPEQKASHGIVGAVTGIPNRIFIAGSDT
jgi:hypothetical protein